MKIQELAVIAMIIIVPMAILLNVYATSQIDTLKFQVQYDQKLVNSTYDAIQAFQLNMSNSSSSDIADSKMRDINASINTFYNSLASNFNMAGYGQNVLKDYVPAIVYTMYDGYYIYSAFDNTLDTATEAKTGKLDNIGVNLDGDASYKNGDVLWGLKPYVYYSCRYKRNNGDDFVITYSLDNYITIRGTIGGKYVNDSGYMLTGVGETTDGRIYYNGAEIKDNENDLLTQNVYVPLKKAQENVGKSGSSNVIQVEDEGQYHTVGNIQNLPYKKVNGVKYYAGTEEVADGRPLDIVFTIFNEEKLTQTDIKVEDVKTNKNAYNFYKDAVEFKNRVLNTYRFGGFKL